MTASGDNGSDDDDRDGSDTAGDGRPPARKINLFGRDIEMPRSRLFRIIIGVLLVMFGIVGFLPVVGFWMIPLGILVLSYEFGTVRRMRRRFVVWYQRRQKSE